MAEVAGVPICPTVSCPRLPASPSRPPSTTKSLDSPRHSQLPWQPWRGFLTGPRCRLTVGASVPRYIQGTQAFDLAAGSLVRQYSQWAQVPYEATLRNFNESFIKAGRFNGSQAKGWSKESFIFLAKKTSCLEKRWKYVNFAALMCRFEV